MLFRSKPAILLCTFTVLLAGNISKADFFGEKLAAIFEVPPGDNAKLVALISDLARAENAPTDDAVDTVVTTVQAGFDATAFMHDQANVGFRMKPKRGEPNAGMAKGRARLYKAITDRAASLEKTQPDHASRTLRVATLLTVLDPLAKSISIWWNDNKDASLVAKRLALNVEQASQFKDFHAGLTKDTQTHWQAFMAFGKAVQLVYNVEDHKLPTAQLAAALDTAEQAWRTPDLKLRFLMALELWYLKCLASGENDAESRALIVAKIAELKEASEDPASKVWAQTAIDLDGERPTKSSMKMWEAIDAKPAAPR